MPKTRVQKEELLQKLRDDVKNRALLLVNYNGLTVAEINSLRDETFAAGCKVKVAKNTLLRKALRDSGVDIADAVLDQPLALIISPDDEVAISKLVQKFADGHDQAEILGGIIDGQFVDTDKVKLLSTLPGREELLARVVGSINAPISGFVQVMVGNLRGLVSVLKQYQEKKNS
jgi:large subunit ribosomal protein L10